MQYKILESLGVEIENTDDAAFNSFLVSGESGIIAGVLNECRLIDLFGTVVIDTGELMIQGFRIKITEAYQYTPVGIAASRTNYHIIGRLELHTGGEVSFNIVTRPVSPLTQDDIHKLGSGIYEVSIATFSHVEDRTVSLTSTLGYLSLAPAIKPAYAKSEAWLKENGDTTKLYVLIDPTNPNNGQIYAWQPIESSEEDTPSEVDNNLLHYATDLDRTTIYGGDYNGDGKNDGYLKGKRLSSSGSVSDAVNNLACCASGFIEAYENNVLRIKGTKTVTGVSTYVIAYDSTNTKTGYKTFYTNPDGSYGTLDWYTVEDDTVIIPLTSANFGSGFNAIRFSAIMDENTVVTIDGVYPGGGNTDTDTENYAWQTTGKEFIPAEYENRILNVEKQTNTNKQNITALQKDLGIAEQDIQKNTTDIATLKKLIEESKDDESEENSDNINKIPTATDLDRTTIYGGDYNGDGKNDGYLKGARLSGSSGNTITGAPENMRVSGFIPASAGDTVRIKGLKAVSGINAYCIAYDSENSSTGYQYFSNNAPANTEQGQIFDVIKHSSTPWYTIEDDTIIISLTSKYFGSGFNAIRLSGYIDENTIVTVGDEGDEPLDEAEKLELIRNWDAPIYDANIPVFELTTEKGAMTNATLTPDNLYSMYDALMAKHPLYITKKDLGLCSDGINHIYCYDFVEPEPYHQSNMPWSETKTKAIIVSGIHYEWAGMFALYYALEEIANNPKLFNLRRNTHFIVIPVINPYCTITANYKASMGVLNANGVQIHRNFEVGFIYPGESGYQEFGTRNHGGTEPLSEIETQALDNIFKENTDSAFFLTCHNYDSPSATNGIGFIWPSTATKYMCNMGYRLIDKMSIAWMDKYSKELEAGIEDYRTDNISDYFLRFGHAHVSLTDGTETRQATKYGIQGANVEVCHTFYPHGTKSNVEPAMSSFTMSRGAETYINFLLTACGCYDYKDKKQYYTK